MPTKGTQEHIAGSEERSNRPQPIQQGALEFHFNRLSPFLQPAPLYSNPLLQSVPQHSDAYRWMDGWMDGTKVVLNRKQN